MSTSGNQEIWFTRLSECGHKNVIVSSGLSASSVLLNSLYCQFDRTGWIFHAAFACIWPHLKLHHHSYVFWPRHLHTGWHTGTAFVSRTVTGFHDAVFKCSSKVSEVVSKEIDFLYVCKNLYLHHCTKSSRPIASIGSHIWISKLLSIKRNSCKGPMEVSFVWASC